MRPGRPRAILAVATAALLALAVAALVVGVLPGDRAIRGLLLGLDSRPVNLMAHVVNYAGEWKVLLPATLVLVAAFPIARRHWPVWVGLMVAAPLAETALKHAVGRARPESPSLGFPSGHATAAAAFFVALIYLSAVLPPTARRALRLLAAVLILLVGVARIVLRAHWPSDVVGGFALGVALASTAALLGGTDGPGAISERDGPGRSGPRRRLR